MVVETKHHSTLEGLPEGITENLSEEVVEEMRPEIESSLAMDPVEAYKHELELITAREELTPDDSWEVLEPLAIKAKQKPDYRRKLERVDFHKLAAKERLRHKGLEARARLHGVKPIGEFRGMVKLFESIRSNDEDKYFYFDAKLSPEQVNSKIKHLEAQGWRVDVTELEDGKKSIRMQRTTTSKIQGKHIDALKVLTKEKSTQILTALSRLGYPICVQNLEDSKITSDLERLLLAKNAEQAIDMYSHITEWNFNSPDFLVHLSELAEEEDPQEILLKEDLDKINLLCKATFKKIAPNEILQYQEIINNPKWLAISTMIAKVGEKSDYMISDLDLYSSLQEWEGKGVIQKLLKIQDAGLNIFSLVESLCRAYSSIADQKPEEAISRIINMEDEPKLKSFLNSPEDQELLKILYSVTGIPTGVDTLEIIKESSLSKESVILIAKQLKEIMPYNGPSDIRTVLLGLLNAPEQLVKDFSDISFLIFAYDLTTRTGLPLNSYQYVFQGTSRLLEQYKKPGLAEQLLADSTIEYIKQLGLREMSAYDLERYVGLAQIPGIEEMTKRLIQFGYQTGNSDNLPSIDWMRRIADDPDLKDLLFSETTQSLAERLKDEFDWKLNNFGLSGLLNLAADQATATAMFEPENLSFLKKIRPKLWDLGEVKSFLDIDEKLRRLLIELSDNLAHYPKTSFGDSRVEGMGVYQKLMEDSELNEALLSDRVSKLALELKEKYNLQLETNSFEMLAKAPDDLLDFIIELREKCHLQWFMSGEILNTVISLALNREHFVPALELLNEHGYEFKTGDFDEFGKLSEVLPRLGEILEMIERLTPLKGGIVPKENGESVNPVNPPNKHYTFKISDVNLILKLSSHLDDLPGTVDILAEEIGYSFVLNDAVQLAKLCEQGIDRAEIASLRDIYAKFVGRKPNLLLPEEFTINQLDFADFLKQNENALLQFESIGYNFKSSDLDLLRKFTQDENRETVFDVAKQLYESLNLPFDLAKLEDYRTLAKIPDLEQRIQETKDSGISPQRFTQISQFRLYVFLQADPKQFEHANQLLSDPYFTNIRDARNRITAFQNAITERNIGNDEAITRIFQICEKPRDLDRLALNITIVSELMSADSENGWQEEFLKITAPNEAESYLNSVMIDLALPQLYPDKDKEAIDQISADFKEKAASDPRRSETLAMCCRSLGIYKKHSQQPRLEILTRGIRDLLELNMNAENSEVYKAARAEASGLQFQRLLSDLDENTGRGLMESWLDLSDQRRLRINGTVVTKEEDTLARLSRIKQMVTSDFAVHFKDLLLSKMTELSNPEVTSKLKGFNPDEIEILKELIGGQDPSEEINILKSYQRVIREIADTRARLKDPEVKGEDKSKDGRNLKTYEAVGSVLKSLFRLGTANEERFKSRKDYINEIDKEINNLSKSLRTLLILDPDRPSLNPDVVSLENEVLADISKIKEVMSEENINSQMTVETRSTVDFLDLAKAPEMTTSCQRLTEHTGYNHAAISRLSDGINEMIDVFEEKDGENIKLARCFIELSKVKLRVEEGEEESVRPVVLMDSLYVNPQYTMQSRLFAEEMVSLMLDRFQDVPDMCIVIGRLDIDRGLLDKILQGKGWKVNQRFADYFVNESTVPDNKYYDSLGGLTDVSKPAYRSFNGLLLEKLSETQPSEV